ncbi:MAG: group III truncated hemoglobin [Microbacterium sp.]|uniref:group III truncated hemoglobin n=1 Tax=Microbacterium sp. TaxID=51671 RepID=UPI0039E6A522
MTDIEDRADIEELVVGFYRAAFADPTLGPIFTEVAKLDLDRHLPIMCDFWETVLLRADNYRRNALQLHLDLHARHPLTADHFGRWLALWTRAVDDRFAGPVADRAKVQAVTIAGSMLRRLAGRSGSAFETITRRDEGEHADARHLP